MPPATDTRIEGLELVPPLPLPGSCLLHVPSLAGIGSEIATSFRWMPPLPFRGRWTARITEFEWNHHFADIPVQGPFRSWLHRHELAVERRNGVSGTLVCDRIEYEIGFGFLGEIAQALFVRHQMEATFAQRQVVLVQRLREAEDRVAIC